MSKSNDSSRMSRELSDSELDAISGGFESQEHATIGLPCANCEAAAVAALNALGRISGGGW
jgi:bacteriocin-like protein